MIFIQRSAGRSYSSVQQTNNFNQRRKGNLGGQNCSNREHEYIHRPNVVKTCFTCRRYTVKSHAGEKSACLLQYGDFVFWCIVCFYFAIPIPRMMQCCHLSHSIDIANSLPFNLPLLCLVVFFVCVCARVFFPFLFGLFALLRLAR